MSGVLAGRRFVVTGAAGGIGASCVRLLQSEGAEVIGVDLRDRSPADNHLQADLGDASTPDRIAELVGDRPLHGLVNNAARSTTTPTSEVGPDLWDDILNVNLRAPFLISERLLPNLSRAAGCVVNIASVHAYATSVGAVPYAASKGGVVAMTRALAIDWAGREVGVRCVGVAPGAIDTPMLRDGLARTDLTIEELGSRHSVTRVGLPEEVAEVVGFLLSDRARFVNGETMVVDGGALAQLSTEVATAHTPPPPRE